MFVMTVRGLVESCRVKFSYMEKNEMIKEIINNVWTWSVYSEEKGFDFNGTLISDGKTQVLIDPVRLDGAGIAAIKNIGPIEAIYLTNKDHERFAYALRSELKVPIWVHALDQGLLKEKADNSFDDGQELACGLRVIHLENQKSPGECAFYLESRELLVLGDALIGNPAGHLNLLPPAKYADIEKARASLARLSTCHVNDLLLGDGVSILGEASKALDNFFTVELNKQ
jgi:glyoxylase-like metal-dependent hydrolase (beta-lactamase superfamily II)